MTRFILAHQTARDRAKAAIDAAPDGWIADIDEPKKRRIQEEKYHAMLGDISKQVPFMDRRWHQDDWKRFLVDAFAKVMRDAKTPLRHDGRVAPSLDFERVVQLGIQTSEFSIKEAAEFIEFLYAWGVEKNVVWKEKKIEPPEGYR